ncbi:hypothetical protein PTSG_01151 [Salpingoeca rosetta]|uniref:Uncharacterized protein n=1 Tax=Salpingoeca rosetta (strain ATCC 50818 / BSB-021) TaxID=946362 RepID=F2U0Y5_SALR5|nr:uncharacterized protein PTSG_01151 [Salpingoeca rosetta]EGD80559.1 hypothetical protein PTSG_01151 [Salpingoeca rosetta]|eukprot:XP_004997120.1 hypothetical protein PTSG_01151 [Salpingoeca rosetta]
MRVVTAVLIAAMAALTVAIVSVPVAEAEDTGNPATPTATTTRAADAATTTTTLGEWQLLKIKAEDGLSHSAATFLVACAVVVTILAVVFRKNISESVKGLFSDKRGRYDRLKAQNMSV